MVRYCSLLQRHGLRLCGWLKLFLLHQIAAHLFSLCLGTAQALAVVGSSGARVTELDSMSQVLDAALLTDLVCHAWALSAELGNDDGTAEATWQAQGHVFQAAPSVPQAGGHAVRQRVYSAVVQAANQTTSGFMLSPHCCCMHFTPNMAVAAEIMHRF